MKNALKSRRIANFVIVATLLTLTALILIPVTTTVSSAPEENKAIYSGSRESDNVSLMFNVYSGGEYIEGILAVLENKGATATFFIGGSWADDNNDLIQKIDKAGMEIANHGYFHRDHSKLGFDKNLEEIAVTDKLLKTILGKNPSNLFAPPSGAFCTDTFKAAESMGFLTIMWSKDTIDWRDKDAKIVFKRATNNVTGGDLVLMHPTEHTLAALPSILDNYKAAGLNAVTVSENIQNTVNRNG